MIRQSRWSTEWSGAPQASAATSEKAHPISRSKTISNEQKGSRIKSLRHALKKIAEGNGSLLDQRDLFLKIPHPLTGGIVWETEALLKLEKHGIVRRGGGSLWVPTEQAATAEALGAKEKIHKVLGFQYVSEGGGEQRQPVPPEATGASLESTPLPDTGMGADEVVDDFDGAAPDDMALASSHVELPEALVANIEYMRDGVEQLQGDVGSIREDLRGILDVVTAPVAGAAPTQTSHDSERLNTLEQVIQGVQKDVQTLTKLVKFAISQWLGEDK